MHVIPEPHVSPTLTPAYFLSLFRLRRGYVMIPGWRQRASAYRKDTWAKGGIFKKLCFKECPISRSQAACTAEPQVPAFLSLLLFLMPCPLPPLCWSNTVHPVGPRCSGTCALTLSLRATLVTHFLHDQSLGAAKTPLNSSVKWVRLSFSDSPSLWAQERNNAHPCSTLYSLSGQEHCLEDPGGNKTWKMDEMTPSRSSGQHSWLQSILITLASPSLWEAVVLSMKLGVSRTSLRPAAPWHCPHRPKPQEAASRTWPCEGRVQGCWVKLGAFSFLFSPLAKSPLLLIITRV